MLKKILLPPLFLYITTYNDVCACVCLCNSVNSCLLSCFPPCLLLSGVRHRSLLHSPNVSQVSLCRSILVNLFDITLGAVTSTLLPAAPATSIVPATLTCCSMKRTHTLLSFYLYPTRPTDKPGTI